MPASILPDIYAFNKQAGYLDGSGADHFHETAYILEEALEGYEAAFNGADADGVPLTPGHPEWVTARQWSLGFMNQILTAFNQRNLPEPSDVANLDKSIDGVVFNIGRIAKMGLSESQAAEAFSVVAAANLSKLSAGRDEHGKQLKPDGWVGPESQLQAILDARKPLQPTLPEN